MKKKKAMLMNKANRVRLMVLLAIILPPAFIICYLWKIPIYAMWQILSIAIAVIYLIDINTNGDIDLPHSKLQLNKKWLKIFLGLVFGVQVLLPILIRWVL